MRINNRGISLVELIVAMAVMALVAICVSELMVSGARMYNYIDKDVKVQYESQLATEQVESYVIDCNGGIAWDDAEGILWLINVSPDGNHSVSSSDASGVKYTIHSFRLDGEILKYAEILNESDRDTLDTFIKDVKENDDIMANYITDFSVDVWDVAPNERLSQIGISMDFDYQGAVYEGELIFAMRNKVYYHSEVEILLDTVRDMN